MRVVNVATQVFGLLDRQGADAGVRLQRGAHALAPLLGAIPAGAQRSTLLLGSLHVAAGAGVLRGRAGARRMGSMRGAVPPVLGPLVLPLLRLLRKLGRRLLEGFAGLVIAV